MKKIAVLALTAFLSAALWAGGNDGFYSPCTFVTLGTNAGYKVVCQVRYENLLDADRVDEAALDRNDKFINRGLETFLKELCSDMSDDEILSCFFYEDIQAYTNSEFEPWLANYIDRINAKYGETVVDVKIGDVRMTAVGAFAADLAE